MPIKRKISFIIILIVFISNFFILENLTEEVSANPLGVNFSSAGGLIPRNFTDLQMIEAEVLMIVDETYGKESSRYSEFNLTFEGHYTIYNPNVTCEMLVGAPFSGYYGEMEETLEISVNGLKTEFELIFLDFEELTSDWWSSYFSPQGVEGSMYYFHARQFALTNITFTGFSNTTIDYSFNGTSWYNCYNDLKIVYDVATGNAWNGSTTETVEFRVIGKQPSQPSNPSTILTISDIDGGKSYMWSWIDVNSIDQKYVGIFYPMANCSDSLIFSSSFLLAISFLTSIGFILKKKRYKKKL
jgi:hypothetical protein